MDLSEKINKNKIVFLSKSGCIYCDKLKEFLKNRNATMINCDEYLKDKESFLLYIKELTGRDWKTFPICFIDSEFIGGYSDVINYFNMIEDF